MPCAGVRPESLAGFWVARLTRSMLRSFLHRFVANATKEGMDSASTASASRVLPPVLCSKFRIRTTETSGWLASSVPLKMPSLWRPGPAGAGWGGRKPPHGRVQTGAFGGRSRRVISRAFCRKADKLGRACKHPGADSRDDLIRIFIEINDLWLLREGGAGIAASLSEDATPTEGSSSGTFGQPQGAAA